MNVLITGGTGLIGRPLTRRLAELGHQVTVLSRKPGLHLAAPGVTLAGWDGHTTAGWGELVETSDVIINLAGENLGESRWTSERKAQIMSSRLDCGWAVSEAVQAAAHKPALLIQASAVGYYGPCDDRPLDESAPAGKDWPARVCVQWEDSTRTVEELGVRRVVLRTGLVLTARGGALQRLLLPFRLYAGGPLGSGRQYWSWIALEDEVDAIIHLMQNPAASGVYNLTAPNPVPMSEFGRVLADVLRRPYWLPVPGFGLKALLGEMSTVVLDGQRVLPRRLLDLGYTFHYDQLRPALQAALARSTVNES